MSSGCVVDPVRVKVNVPGCAPASDAAGSDAVMATVGRIDAWAGMHAENSDVCFVPLWVAVAVNCSPAPAIWNAWLNDAMLSVLVVAVTLPRKVWPSPLPDASQVAFEKSSTVNVVLGVLFSVPAIDVVVPSVVAELSTGKF